MNTIEEQEQAALTPQFRAVEFNEKPVVVIEEEPSADVPDEGAGKNDVIDDTPPTPPAEPVEDVNVDEAKLVSHINKKFGRDFQSIDDVLKQEEKIVERELDGDVAAFQKFKKETGRGLEDFIKLQKDFTTMDPDKVLEEHYAHIYPDLTKEDIKDLISNKFGYDEELDTENDIKSRKLAKKIELIEAQKNLNELKKEYSIPVSRESPVVPDEEKELFEEFKQSKIKSSEIDELNNKKSLHYQSETDKLFSDSFKGFEFKVGENNLMFEVPDADVVKKNQTDILKFISRFTDENGFMVKAADFHKAMLVASDPDKFAEHFYELGKAHIVDEHEKERKAIDMGKQTPQNISRSGGVQFKALETPEDYSFGIKKNK